MNTTDDNLHYVQIKQLERVKKALESNLMNTYIVNSSKEVIPLLKELIPENSVVANGGSVTLKECGILNMLRNGKYNFLDRDASNANPDKIYHEAFNSDVYLASANAVTENGEIYQVDGNSNRIAAIAFGPKKVILVVGRNKIVPNLDAASYRLKHIAAPANTRRLSLDTPCYHTGACSDCKSPNRICCNELVLRQQRTRGRVNIILVNEDLGY